MINYLNQDLKAVQTDRKLHVEAFLHFSGSSKTELSN
jgi:hypothetical protein